MHLLTLSNAKTEKGQKLNVLTGILHLAPSRLSGYNVCPMASAGCIAGCLNTAGRGVYQKVQNARIRKTKMFFEQREAFMFILVNDIRALVRKAQRQDMAAAARLNGTSDVRWELIPLTIDGTWFPNIMAAFPDVQFYDYRKVPKLDNLPTNYHITFSRSESNDADALSVLHAGFNVAVVFAGKVLPETWEGFRVIDGTEHDLRFLDPRGVVVGLLAKGRARRDTSGFVVHI